MDYVVDPSQFYILLSVAVAMLLGGILGLEREIAEKPAGLRTHMLVAGAAALLVSLSNAAVEHFTADVGSDLVRTDPIRILEAVIAGVSFLGAGTIMRRRSEHEIEGLTTAASMLFVAAVGVCVGLDQWIVGVGVTLLGLIILHIVPRIEQRLKEQLTGK
jgi:putative Mg2+ transporter-C (MgtC) family protein